MLDKVINKAVKWENVDISISEMVNLIQSEILEKVGSNELRELEKGMNKTWVLGVGSGANRRYYPSSGAPVRLCLKFNVLTHQLQQITLQDTVNKKEYFIPKGKAASTKLQRAVLRRMVQHNHDGAVKPRQQGSNGRFLNKKKKSPIPILIACCLLVIASVGAIIILPRLGNSSANAVETVQNGYLGEYTDITVKEILDSYYGMLYDHEQWDSGTTDSGTEIVQVRYFYEGMEEDAVTIQFTMLNEECFKITALADPDKPIEQATDLLAAMNYNYLLAYMGANRSVAGDPAAEKVLIDRLNGISGSAVQYGSAADYRGDRAALCEADGQAPLNVSVAMLLDNYGLLDVSPYLGDAGTEPTETADNRETEPAIRDTEPTEPVTETTEPPAADPESMLTAVLKGEQTFVMSETGKAVSIYQVYEVAENEFDDPLIPIRLAYVDMDQDGQREAIVELTNNANGWRVVLRYQDGDVYGYGFNFRGLQSVSTDGLAMASSGAAYTDIFRLEFDNTRVKAEYLSSVESEYALENWVEVTWYDYSVISSGSASQEKPAGSYPLDFINCSTGDVVDALGETYIYEDGYAGSKLFYYGSEPDVHYGFVPADWAEPVLTGNEPISLILLFGDAQINAYLSADMNKEEIDSVAWDTPNVLNVSNGSSYDMMSGNIYSYEIETTEAFIIYTWYLDEGDSIEHAATEVVVFSK